MGNHTSACSFMKTNKASRVMFPSGEIRQFRESVKVAEIMFECPGFFLVNSRTLNMKNRRFSPLLADEDLLPGNVYIMFPMRRVNSMVTPADMAVFWMVGSNTGKRINKTMSTEMEGSDGDGGGEVKVVDQPRLVAEVPEFSCRLAVIGRSRKPVLDTIMEEPVCARYNMQNWIYKSIFV